MQKIPRAAGGRHRPTEEHAGAWRAHLPAALAYIDVHAKCNWHDTLMSVGGHFWREGLATDDVRTLLVELNRRHGKKPRKAEICGIVRSLARKPRDGTKGRTRSWFRADRPLKPPHAFTSITRSPSWRKPLAFCPIVP